MSVCWCATAQTRQRTSRSLKVLGVMSISAACVHKCHSFLRDVASAPPGLSSLLRVSGGAADECMLVCHSTDKAGDQPLPEGAGCHVHLCSLMFFHGASYTMLFCT